MPVYHHVLPELRDHPLFSGQHTVGMVTGENPAAPSAPGGNAALKQDLGAAGLQHEGVEGHYGAPEHSLLVYNPTREQMYALGKKYGQESVIFSHRGHHELLYTNGPHDKKYHPSHPQYSYHPTAAPPDYYTRLPGKGYVRLYFDDKLINAPLRPGASAPAAVPLQAPQPGKAAVAKALRKALQAAAGPAWAGATPWHEPHTAHNHRGALLGVVVPRAYFHGEMRKDALPHPHTAAHGTAADFGGGTALPTNSQAGDAGTSKAYGRFAAPYGSTDRAHPSVLKYYPLEGKHAAADALVQHHGFQTYYAGGPHGKPDLAAKNYNTGHLMVYDPSTGAGGDFGDTSYTDTWRKTHELAHALTLPQLNAKYGEGRRMGALGKHRTLREAKRAVEWEWLAAHKQRELASHLGATVSDDDFHRELNTVMHDAVHRAVTGRFTDPQQEGFRPHAHKVPLQTALGMVDEAGAQLGLQGPHDLLRKALAAALQAALPGKA